MRSSVTMMAPVGPHDRRRRKIRRRPKHGGPSAPFAPLTTSIKRVLKLRVNALPAPISTLAPRATGEPAAARPRACLDVLAYQRRPFPRTGLDVGARVLRLRGEGLLVGGKGEGRTVGEDLREVSGALPAVGEGADAVGAAEVGEGGEAVGDRAVGSDVRRGFFGFLDGACSPSSSHA